MTTTSLSEMAARLRGCRRVFVAGHRSPEGDALGASLGLVLALEKLSIEATLFNADPCPPGLRFLPRVEDRLTRELSPATRYDVAVLCDCADPQRVADNLLETINAPVWMVLDHHRTESRFEALGHNDPAAPATCELVLQLLGHLGVEVDADIAACLYTGLAVDTGNFRFSNSTVRAFEAAAGLVRAGADAPAIAHQLFEELPASRLRLLGSALQTLEVSQDGRIASLTIDAEMLRQNGATVDDMDGLVHYPRALAGCAAAILYYISGDGAVRVSLRTSLEPVDVEAVARAFGGGGHQHAAGCTLQTDFDEAKRLVEAEVEKMLRRRLP